MQRHSGDDELRHMLATTSDVAERVIRPLASALDDGLWSAEVWATLRGLDVFGMSTAERLGGLGLPYSSYLWVTAELSRTSAVAGLLPALNVLVARALEQFGSPEVIEQYLPRLLSGEDIACWAFTEPATGSDPRAITTRAEAASGGWRITGHKSFISHSSHATVAVVFAQFDGALSAFIGRTEGRRMLATKADVRDFGQVKKAVDDGVAELGRLDISISNAAIAPMSFAVRSEEEDVETWRAVIDVNLTGAWIAAKAAVPHIQAGGRGGSVIFISSSSALKGFAGYAGAGGGYTAAKAGMLGLVRSMANALAPESIRVNGIVPTAVNTMMATNQPMTDWINEDPSRAKHMANPMPVGMVEPIDTSNAIAYLVCDTGRYVTGVSLPVDAGFVNK